MTAALLSMWLAAFPLMGSPGPATLSLAAIGAAYGSRAGLGYLAGIVSGTCCVLVMIATGITGLIMAWPALANALVVAAAAYIIYLAIRIATAPPVSKDRKGMKLPSLPGGFGLAIANPKAFAAIAAVYGGHQLVQHNPALDAVAKITALSLVIIAVNAAWLVLGSLISALLHDPVKARFTNIAFSIMLLASVASALPLF